MATYWQTECVEIVRHLINDLADTPTYTDSRLVRLLVVAALQVTEEISFSTTYTVDISLSSITPDPSASTSRDNAFINFICLKAAVILLDGELRYYSIGGVRVTDGPSTIDTTSRVGFVKQAADVMNKKYSQVKIMHQMGVAGTAILTPYTVQNLYPDTRFS